MHHSRKLLAATVAAFAFFSAPAVKAETPPDTLIQAWAIDDIISLDPAEIFEFTASEIAGNSYEGLIGYDPMDVTKIYGKIAESWEVAEDGMSITFKIRPGRTFAGYFFRSASQMNACSSSTDPPAMMLSTT